MYSFKVSTPHARTASLHLADWEARKRRDIGGMASKARRIARYGILAIATVLSNVALPNAAHAQTMVTLTSGVSLSVQVHANDAAAADTEGPPARSAYTSTSANFAAVSAGGQAQFGVLHAQVGSKTVLDPDYFDTDPLVSGTAFSTVSFMDVVFVSDPHVAADVPLPVGEWGKIAALPR